MANELVGSLTMLGSLQRFPMGSLLILLPVAAVDVCDASPSNMDALDFLEADAPSICTACASTAW